MCKKSKTKLIRSLGVILLMIFILKVQSQVKAVKLMVNYNTATSLHDCYVIIEEGRTLTVKDRIQFNSSYSIVAPAGANLTIAQRYMPLQNNFNFEGDIAADWQITTIMKSPKEDVKNDYYYITPNLSSTNCYNNLSQGDTILLFSLKAGTKYCGNEIRLYENNKDIEIFPVDLMNGFCIGNVKQLYRGNVVRPNSFIDLGDETFCLNEVVSLPSNIKGSWQIENKEVITVNNGQLTCVGSGQTSAIFTHLDGCISKFDQLKVHNSTKPILEKPLLLVGEEMMLASVTDVVWKSSDEAVAKISANKNLVGLRSGKTTVSFEDKNTGCPSMPADLEVTELLAANNYDFAFKMYPNPSDEIININSFENIQEVSIYSNDTLMLKDILDNPSREHKVNISNLPGGIYNIKLKSGNAVTRPKPFFKIN